eukprot:TRINITY_DN67219_c3_g1_i1.p1 TRINITY_DN67219_c3_g1~~TRINITY_DN67219_c3_g1_i1.p1  ORF type:complete len:342 (+),score=26.18 TRINITY_DN67219_c3_g1_i1:48-1073(+)
MNATTPNTTVSICSPTQLALPLVCCRSCFLGPLQLAGTIAAVFSVLYVVIVNPKSRKYWTLLDCGMLLVNACVRVMVWQILTGTVYSVAAKTDISTTLTTVGVTLAALGFLTQSVWTHVPTVAIWFNQVQVGTRTGFGITLKNTGERSCKFLWCPPSHIREALNDEEENEPVATQVWDHIVPAEQWWPTPKTIMATVGKGDQLACMVTRKLDDTAKAEWNKFWKPRETNPDGEYAVHFFLSGASPWVTLLIALFSWHKLHHISLWKLKKRDIENGDQPELQQEEDYQPADYNDWAGGPASPYGGQLGNYYSGGYYGGYGAGDYHGGGYGLGPTSIQQVTPT